MKELEDRIRADGIVIDNEILKVDSFINHQIDTALVRRICAYLVEPFHGDSKNVIAALKLLKKTFPHTDIIAGNVATYEGARDLMEAGADAVKVGMDKR